MNFVWLFTNRKEVIFLNIPLTPYTNLHELNLDWLIGQVKAAIEAVSAFEVWKTDTDAAIAALHAYIDDRIDNLDIAQAINDKIDEMAGNGTLAALMASYLDPSFVFKRMFRLQTAKDTARYSQSITSDGTYFYVAGPSTDEQHQYLAKVSTTGAVISAQSFDKPDDLGHIASMAYLDGYIYTTDPARHKIGRIDTSNWSVATARADIINPGEYSDEMTITAVTAYNDTLYMLITGTNRTTQRIATYDWDTNTRGPVVCTFSLPRDNHNRVMTRQGFAIIDGFAYVSGSLGSQILKVNMSSGSIVDIIKMPMGDGMYPVGEMEGMCNKGGVLYFLSSWVRNSGVWFSYQYANVWQTNIGAPGSITWYAVDNVRNERRYLQVNSSSTQANPDGSNDFPFSSVEEACYVYEYLYKSLFPCTYEGINIAASSSGCLTLGGVTAAITGNNSTITNLNLYDGTYRLLQLEVEDSTESRLINTHTLLQSCKLSGDCGFLSSTITLANTDIAYTKDGVYHDATCSMERCTINVDQASQTDILCTSALQSTFNGLTPVALTGVEIGASETSDAFNIPIVQLQYERLRDPKYIILTYSASSCIQSVKFPITQYQATQILTNNGTLSVSQRIPVRSVSGMIDIPVTFAITGISGKNVQATVARGADEYSADITFLDVMIKC